jgi:hypothetical protein
MQDIRFALRLIATRRWFSAAVVVTLALGIGINTTVFTLVNAVLFKPLPFPDGERLVTIANTRPAESQNNINVSFADFGGWSRRSPRRTPAFARGSRRSTSGSTAARSGSSSC